MTLQVSEELESRLRIAAEQRCDEPARLANDLLAQALDSNAQVAKPQPSADALLAGFQKLAETATAVRNYPEDFFSRDIIYADHD